MLNRIAYAYNDHTKTLRLGRGKEQVFFDSYNSHFYPLVTLFDQLNLKKIIVSDVNPKVFLLICRALFHSQLTHIAFHLALNHQLHSSEDYLYCISKTFGESATLLRKVNYKNRLIFCFDLQRQLPSFNNLIDFYIITNGKNLFNLEQCLKSIFAQQGLSTEVYVIAPARFGDSYFMQAYPQCKLIADDAIYSRDIRFPLSRKKNLALAHSQAEMMVLLHDRITLSPDWLTRLLHFSPKFDFYTCRIIAGGKRYPDKFSLNIKGYLFWRKCHYFLSYGEDNSTQFIDGGFIVLNRKGLAAARFDEHLYWEEMEDIDFVLKQKIDAKTITFDVGNSIESIPTRHFSLKPNSPMSYLYKVWFKRSGLGLYVDRFIRYAKYLFKKIF